jgi:signal transduction histidine kinase
MPLSLRQRTLLWIVAIHGAAVGIEFALFGDNLARTRRAEAVERGGELVSTLRSLIQPQGGLNTAPLLRWSGWTAFEDALVLDRNLVTQPGGGVAPAGIALNPLGAARRDATFDANAIYVHMEHAIRTRSVVDDIGGGRVVPIDTREGVWGACWYRIAPDVRRTRQLALTFVVLLGSTTAAIAAVLFFALRRDVLDPVSRLTSAARRVAAGDLDVRVQRANDDELGVLTDTFNAMVDDVRGFNTRLKHEVQVATEQARAAEAAAMTQRRLAATGELAAGIAHEINNPLGGLLNAVERLQRDDLPQAKRAQYVALLSSGLERIRDTVGKLLRFTPRQARLAPLTLWGPAHDALELVRHRAQQQAVELEIAAHAQGPSFDPFDSATPEHFAALAPIDGHAHEIAQAILNLLVNALDALEGAAPGGARRIRVVLAQERDAALGPCAVLEVHDSGPGVERSELGRVLDLFYTTKEVGRGTGLGLALVHNVVTGHGGRLELDSAPGRGFHVRVLLPRRAQPDSAGSERP